MSHESSKNFNLTCDESFNENNVVYHFKLTDSALKAFESLSKSLHNDPLKICFSGNLGEISINQKGLQKSFAFNVAPINDDGKGSYECVKINNRGARMQALGKMQHRVAIQANEDAFSMTRDKFSTFEDEQRKNCTKVLKPGSRGTKSGHPSHIQKARASHPVVSAPNRTLGRPLDGVSRPGLSSSTSNPVLQRSLKERIIHLLILKSYNKPELTLRLIKDGLRPQDRERVEEAALSVSNQDAKGNYSLRSDILTLVDPQWPFFTQEERQLVLRRTRQDARVSPNVTSHKNADRSSVSPPRPKTSLPSSQPPSRDDTSFKSSTPRGIFSGHSLELKIRALDLLSEGLSPMAASLRLKVGEKLVLRWKGEETQLREMYNRKRENNGLAPHIPPSRASLPTESCSPAKRPRISSSSSAEEPLNQSKTHTHSSNLSKSSTDLSNQSVPFSVSPAGEKENTEVSPPKSTAPIGSEKVEKESEPIESEEMREELSPMSVSTSDKVCGTPLSSITGHTNSVAESKSSNHASHTPKERDHLKRQFNQLYPEYLQLFKQINEKSDQITFWDKRLQSVPSGSQEYDNICSSIINLYNEVKNSPYREMTARLQKLHHRLHKYKSKIKEIDSRTRLSVTV